MVEKNLHTPIKLFYSYSHKDETYRKNMEKSLAILEQDGLLYEWFDGKILPGANISPKIMEEMDRADIFVFLISPDFMASQECKKEWGYAGDLCTDGNPRFRIPVIVRACPWPDLLKSDDVKALPKDGKPVASYDHQDDAWLEVYQGVKEVLNKIRNCFTPREDFIEKVEHTEFISQQHIKLQDIFLFPKLTDDTDWDIDQAPFQTATVKEEGILDTRYTLIHGEDKSGKTTLARHLYLSLVEKRKAALLVDLKERRDGLNEHFVRQAYQTQFHGDFSLWNQQTDKTLVLENMTESPRMMRFIEQAKENFTRIITTTTSDTFYSYFKDENRLADFRVLRIGTLTRDQQEQLIRKRLEMMEGQQPVTDGRVDQEENAVNSVIISNKLIPRYPFYVLSILQTREAFMPNNLTVTSYGHCYHALIVARPVTDGRVDQEENAVNSVIISNKLIPRYPFYVLSILQTREAFMPNNLTVTSYGHCYHAEIRRRLIKAGISQKDEEVGACFNLAEQLSYETYIHKSPRNKEKFDFSKFIERYKEKFLINASTVNRLKNSDYGLIDEEGNFRSEYMYYYFLGEFIATHNEEGKPIIEKMCENSHIEVNYLTLLFAIHHARDNEIIDGIMLQTMCALDIIAPATLDREETKQFRNVLEELPKSILSKRSVIEERKKVRDSLPEEELQEDEETSIVDEETSIVNDVYRILKNNKIMGQILKNHYGAIEKTKVEEIISIIASSGLRLVKMTIQEEEDLGQLILYIRDKHPTWPVHRIQRTVERLAFLWTVGNIEMIVKEINLPEIREAVKTVVNQESTPAYDLVGYFSQLDSGEQLREQDRRTLKDLWEEHEDPFIRRLLSLRTQIYMNSHKSDWKLERQICSVIGIKRVPRLGRGEG